MSNLFYEQLEKQSEGDFIENISQEELDNITEWLISHIFRNSDIMFNDEIRGDVDAGEETDMCFIIASLHNMLYKAVTGEYYDYMFHWANKVGSWVYDDLFKEECEKHERN